MSEVPKWTPGPWETRPMKNATFIVKPHQFIESGLYVAEVSAHAWQPEETRVQQREANARLIAAAPDLENVAEMLLEANRIADARSFTSKIALVCEHARAALAKVRGEV